MWGVKGPTKWGKNVFFFIFKIGKLTCKEKAPSSSGWILGGETISKLIASVGSQYSCSGSDRSRVW